MDVHDSVRGSMYAEGHEHLAACRPKPVSDVGWNDECRTECQRYSLGVCLEPALSFAVYNGDCLEIGMGM